LRGWHALGAEDAIDPAVTLHTNRQTSSMAKFARSNVSPGLIVSNVDTIDIAV
jgi:hypothetical protein